MKAKLAKKEGLFVVISSGANVFAAMKAGVALGINNQVLTISPGSGPLVSTRNPIVFQLSYSGLMSPVLAP